MVYVHRKIGGKEDFEIFDMARERGFNVLLSGPTGAAKTMSGREYAKSRGLDYTKVSCSVSVDPTSLFGRYVPTEDGFKWQDGTITACMRKGEGVLCLDEINMMHPKVSASLFSLLDSSGHITLLDNDSEVVDRPDGLLIVATMNPHYAGTMKLNAAFLNRFPIIVNWDYDSRVERQLVKSPTLLKTVNNWRNAGEIQSPLSTNMMMEFEEISGLLGIEVAILSFVQHIEESQRADVVSTLHTIKGAISKELFGEVERKPRASAPTMKNLGW